MKNKLILPISVLLLFSSLIMPVSAANSTGEVTLTTNITFSVDDDVKISKGNNSIINNIINNGLQPYEYKLVGQEVKSKNLPSNYILGIEKPGYTFSNWKIIYKTAQNNAISSLLMFAPTEQEIEAVAQAQWKRNVLSVNYNANGGTLSKNKRFKLDKNKNIIYKGNGILFEQKFTYGMKREAGLVNAKSFSLKRDGYVFVGWSLYKNGKVLLDENASLAAEDITNKVLKKNEKVVLYAQWMPEKVSIIYSLNDDTESVDNNKFTTEKNIIKTQKDNKTCVQKYVMNKTSSVVISANVFEITKPYCKFVGWTNKQGSDKVIFKAREKVNYKKLLPLLTKNKSTIKLYPVWREYTFPLDKSGGLFISSYQGERVHPVYNIKKYHSGLDIAACGGTKIYAVDSGTVTKVGKNMGFGYGNYVKIDHGNGVETLYAHASKTLVKEGDKVKAGDVIALVGTTGTSTGNHLHLEFIVNGELKDPMKYIDFTGIPVRI